MIYTDGVHLVGDTLSELHAFVRKMGFKREWFQNHPRHPHYDLTTGRALRRALQKGAIKKTDREVLAIAEKAAREEGKEEQ